MNFLASLWTSEQEVRLAETWHANWPVKLIAKELNKTRMAVMAKVYRMKLPRREMPKKVKAVRAMTATEKARAAHLELSIAEEQKVVDECTRREKVLHAAWKGYTLEEMLEHIKDEPPTFVKETLAEFVKVGLIRKKTIKGKVLYLNKEINEVNIPSYQPAIRVFPGVGTTSRNRREF